MSAANENQVLRVSVIMPAFNVAPWLHDAAQSVLAQTFKDLELIIVDDCSTDSTRRIADDLAASDDRVRVLATGSNIGGARARNLGLSAARGSYVAFLDGDDLWAPEKLERQLQVMAGSGAALCYTAIQKIDAEGLPFGRLQEVPPSISYDGLLGNPVIGCSTALMDYQALGRPLMPDIRKRQDFAFWLMLLRAGAKAVGINEPLTCYRVRPGSLSSNKISAAWHVWRVYREFEHLPLRRAVLNFVSYALRGYLKRSNR
ncbi:MAG TPA: glycosyltransferase family 2 protein [Gammaproteobacteria bacterium]